MSEVMADVVTQDDRPAFIGVLTASTPIAALNSHGSNQILR
jgi:hypothetical protein